MAQQPDTAEAPPALPALKIVEPHVDAENPWGDDVLKRREIADRLTSIVRGQEAPFVISLDGRWGTGKTFLLERWAQDLQNNNFEAIYFNAWEDDFSKDPLLAIIGQLSEHFGEGPLRQLAVGVAGAALNILTNRLVGMKFDELTPESLLDDYRDQQATQRAVKERLAELGAKVREDREQPLVFIIDELDRCRPTFAIELLERVKHIFDVENIVFVFGINREQLTKSLQSVYGEIDAGEYLRRFFDMEFVLPDGDPTRFCAHLLEQFQLLEFLRGLNTSTGRQHATEAMEIGAYLPVLLGNMGLSLRDMDYCVRLLSIAARELTGRYPLHPGLFLLLVAVKVREPDLYRRFIEGNARGAEVIDYLDDCTSVGIGGTEYHLVNRKDLIEFVHAAAYAADDAETVRRQLERLGQDLEPDRPEYLSREHARLRSTDSATLSRLDSLIGEDAKNSNGYGVSLGYLAELIDPYADFVRP